MGQPDDLIKRLLAEAGTGERRAAPPVERWNPPDCGNSAIEILADGTWRHEGARITRESLVRLFASILRKDEDGRTWLVTPVERLEVKVEDSHFLAVRVDREGEGRDQTLVFTTNVGDVFPLDADHPLRFVVDEATGEPRPYARVRGRLEARILRAPFYEMVAWGEEGPEGFGLWSGGVWWGLG